MLTRSSVFIAGEVLKKSLATFPDKVDGQEAVSDKKAKLIYGALDAFPAVYKVGSEIQSVQQKLI
jgi:phosphoserine aminotransferase